MAKSNMMIMVDRPSSQYHSHKTTIKEVRAPTDDSVSLLMEMEEKALNKLIGSYIPADNSLNVVAHAMSDPLELRIKIIVKYSLNGRDRQINLTTDYDFTEESISAQVMEAVRDDLARVISSFALRRMDRRK